MLFDGHNGYIALSYCAAAIILLTLTVHTLVTGKTIQKKLEALEKMTRDQT